MTENKTSLPAPLSVTPFAFAHQAILDQNRAVFGYELFDRSALAQGHTAASDAQLLGMSGATTTLMPKQE